MSQLLHQKHYLQVETKSRTSITSFSPERFILRENGKSAQGGLAAPALCGQPSPPWQGRAAAGGAARQLQGARRSAAPAGGSQPFPRTAVIAAFN